MDPRRSATVAVAICGTIVLADLFIAWPASFGSAGVDTTGAVPVEHSIVALLTADAARGAARPAAGKAALRRRCDVGPQLGDGDSDRHVGVLGSKGSERRGRFA